MLTDLSKAQLLAAYDIVFDKVHSDVFKCSEIRDLLYEDAYLFHEEPRKGWYDSLITYLVGIDYDITRLKMNPSIVGVNS